MLILCGLAAQKVTGFRSISSLEEERPLLAHCRFALARSSSRFGDDSEFITATICRPHRSPSGLG
jgi:hypothetical protein